MDDLTEEKVAHSAVINQLKDQFRRGEKLTVYKLLHLLRAVDDAKAAAQQVQQITTEPLDQRWPITLRGALETMYGDPTLAGPEHFYCETQPPAAVSPPTSLPSSALFTSSERVTGLPGYQKKVAVLDALQDMIDEWGDLTDADTVNAERDLDPTTPVNPQVMITQLSDAVMVQFADTLTLRAVHLTAEILKAVFLSLPTDIDRTTIDATLERFLAAQQNPSSPPSLSGDDGQKPLQGPDSEP